MVDTVGTRFTLAGQTAMFNFTSDSPPYHLVWRDYHFPNSTTHVSLEETLHGITSLALDRSRDIVELRSGSFLHPEIFRGVWTAVSTLQNLLSTTSCWRKTKEFIIDPEGAIHDALTRRTSSSFTDIRVAWNVLIHRLGTAQERLRKLCFLDSPLLPKDTRHGKTQHSMLQPTTTAPSMGHVTSRHSAPPSPSSDRPSRPSATSATPHKVTKHDVRMKDKDRRGQERTERMEMERIQVAGGNNVCSTSSASDSSLVGFPAGLLHSNQAPPPPPLAPALPSRARDPPDRAKSATSTPSGSGLIFSTIVGSFAASSIVIQPVSSTVRDAAAAHRDGASTMVIKQDNEEMAVGHPQQDSPPPLPTREHFPPPPRTTPVSAPSSPAAREEQRNTLSDNLSPSPALTPPILSFPTIARSFVESRCPAPADLSTAQDETVPPHDSAAIKAVRRETTIEQSPEHPLSLPPTRAHCSTSPPASTTASFPPATLEECRRTLEGTLLTAPTLALPRLTLPTIFRSLVDSSPVVDPEPRSTANVAVPHHDGAAITAVRRRATVEQPREHSLSLPPARALLPLTPPSDPASAFPPTTREEQRNTLSDNLSPSPALSLLRLAFPAIARSFLDWRCPAPVDSPTAQDVALPYHDGAAITTAGCETTMEQSQERSLSPPPTRGHHLTSPPTSPTTPSPPAIREECRRTLSDNPSPARTLLPLLKAIEGDERIPGKEKVREEQRDGEGKRAREGLVDGFMRVPSPCRGTFVGGASTCQVLQANPPPLPRPPDPPRRQDLLHSTVLSQPPQCIHPGAISPPIARSLVVSNSLASSIVKAVEGDGRNTRKEKKRKEKRDNVGWGAKNSSAPEATPPSLSRPPEAPGPLDTLHLPVLSPPSPTLPLEADAPAIPGSSAVSNGTTSPPSSSSHPAPIAERIFDDGPVTKTVIPLPVLSSPALKLAMATPAMSPPLPRCSDPPNLATGTPRSPVLSPLPCIPPGADSPAMTRSSGPLPPSPSLACSVRIAGATTHNWSKMSTAGAVGELLRPTTASPARQSSPATLRAAPSYSSMYGAPPPESPSVPSPQDLPGHRNTLHSPAPPPMDAGGQTVFWIVWALGTGVVLFVLRTSTRASTHLAITMQTRVWGAIGDTEYHLSLSSLSPSHRMEIVGLPWEPGEDLGGYRPWVLEIV